MKRPIAVLRVSSAVRGEHDGDDGDGERQAEEMAVAEEDERRVFESDDLSAADEHRDAAADDHEDERGDDRLDAQRGDEHAIPSAEQSTGHEADAEHRDERHPGADDEHRRERAGDRHDRANGEIDAARGDDERHAEREEHHLRALVEHVHGRAVEVAVLDDEFEEGRLPNEVEKEEGGEREQRPEQAAAGEPASEFCQRVGRHGRNGNYADGGLLRCTRRRRVMRSRRPPWARKSRSKRISCRSIR